MAATVGETRPGRLRSFATLRSTATLKRPGSNQRSSERRRTDNTSDMITELSTALRKALKSDDVLESRLRSKTRVKLDPHVSTLRRHAMEVATAESKESKITEKELICFEHALHCVLALYPVEEERRTAVQRLSRAFEVPQRTLSEIRSRVESTAGLPFFLKVAELQLSQIDRHPLYEEREFSNPAARQAWQTAEKKRISARIAELQQAIQGRKVDVLGRLRIEVQEGNISRSVKEAGTDFMHKLANATVVKDGTYHPYVRIKVLKNVYETQTHDASSVPTWNETFLIEIPHTTSDDTPIKISAFHKIPNFPDVLIGKLKLTLRDIKSKGGYIDTWFNLDRGKSSSTQDSIKMSITFVQIVDGIPPTYKLPVDFSSLYYLLLDKLVSFDSVHGKKLRSFAQKFKEITPYVAKTGVGADIYLNDASKESDVNEEKELSRSGATVNGIKRFELSPQSTELLQEFARCYNIPSHRVDLATLELLAYYGDSQEHLEQLYSLITKYDKEENRKEFTKTELARFNEMRAVTMAFVDNCMSHVTQVFTRPSNKQNNSVFVSAVKLYSYFHKDTLIDDFRLALRASVEISYNCMKFEAQEQLSSDLSIDEMRRELLLVLRICDEMINEADDYINYYAPLIPSGVNALYVVIEEFVNLYAEDVSNLFLSDKETRVSDMTVVFQIYARIRYLFETWRNYSTALENRIPIYNYVEKHIYGWLHEIDCSLSIWAMNAMKNDDSTPLGSDVLHSSSVVDLFNATSETLKVLRSVLNVWHRPSAYKFLDRFAGDVGKIAVSYCDSVALDFESSIKQYLGDDSTVNPTVGNKEMKHEISKFFEKLFTQKSKQRRRNEWDGVFRITQALCVKLNDVDVCRQLLNEFASEVGELFLKAKRLVGEKNTPPDIASTSSEEYIHRTFSKPLSEIKKRLDYLLQSIAYALRSVIEHEFRMLLKLEVDNQGRQHNHWRSGKESQPDVDKCMTGLYEYLNEQLGQLSSNIYQTIFTRLLKHLFAQMVNALQKLMLPDGLNSINDFLSQDQIPVVQLIIMSIRDFFHADGAGLSLKAMEKDIQRLSLLGHLLQQPTEQVVSLLNGEKDDVVIDFISRLLELRAAFSDDKIAMVVSQNISRKPRNIDQSAETGMVAIGAATSRLNN